MPLSCGICFAIPGSLRRCWCAVGGRCAMPRDAFAAAPQESPPPPRPAFDDSSDTAKPEPPRPLMRELPSADPFPVDALGDILGAAARAIHDRVQAPIAIGAQSVIAAAALAVQGY